MRSLNQAQPVAAATIAIVVSVICDGALTALRLLGTEFSARAVVPIVSMAIEATAAVVLVLSIRNISQQTASVALRNVVPARLS